MSRRTFFRPGKRALAAACHFIIQAHRHTSIFFIFFIQALIEAR